MIPLNPPYSAGRPLKVHEKDVERYLSMGYSRIEKPAPVDPPTPKRTRRTSTKE